MARDIVARSEAIAAGRKTYFTGLPCKNGHISHRHTHNGICAECKRTTHRAVKHVVSVESKVCRKCQIEKPAIEFHKRASSKDGINTYCKACQIEFSGCSRGERTEETRMQERESWNRRREKNPEEFRRKQREKQAKARANNIERYREIARASQHKRRAAKRNSLGQHTAHDVKEIYILQKGRCPICSVRLGKRYHIDHVMPLSLGGSNDRSNIQILCPRCNLQKNKKHPVDFMQSKGFLI